MENFVVFGLSASKKLSNEICKHLKVKPGEIIKENFLDGEIKTKTKNTVRNRDVYLIQSTSLPVNENLMELLISIDMLKRASAKSINVILPYYGYSRQDRKGSGREPITAKLVADLIVKAGATKVVLMDIHADQIQGFFDIPVDSLKAMWLLLKEVIKDHKTKNLMIISPDYGAVKRARNIAESINAPLAIVDKRRPRPNVAEALNILGDVSNKDCVIVDDMIDTGGTVISAAQLLKKNGAKSVSLMATHGIFSESSKVSAVIKLNEAIDNGIIDKIYISNSIESVYNKKIKNLKIVDISKFYADVITAYTKNKSISQIYQKYSFKCLKS